MIPALDDLRIVELSRLILHEAYDPARLARIREGIKTEAVLRNPVIVAPYDGRYLVLDGAHRVHALTELGSRLVLVQLTDLPERGAGSWGHLLPTAGLEGTLRSVEGVEVSAEKPDDDCLAEVQFRGGKRLYVRARDEGLVAAVRALRALQAVHPEGAAVRRVDPKEPVELGVGEALLLYRRFTPGELVEVVARGEVLPAGITRFLVKERVLNVRYPLDFLNGGDLAARNAQLQEFVKESWQKNRIRYYAEPVVLFE